MLQYILRSTLLTRNYCTMLLGQIPPGSRSCDYSKGINIDEKKGKPT